MPSRRLLHLVVSLLAVALPRPAEGQVGPVRVTGTVTSAADGLPLSGARVFVKGTSIGTLAGTNGRYAIDARSPQDTLVFTLIGYQQVEVGIAERSVVNVSMAAAAVAMQEVVVTGYGTQQRRDVTGAVASVDAADLPPLATASIDQMLQGRIAGVRVTPASGRPGAGAIVRIRGIGTLNDASPLYVVDGVLLDDVAFLNPNDVASVEVLKDASAAAIYGSRGANGVIMITTKRGNLDRRTRFTLSAYTGMQRVLDPIDMVTGREYAELANELAVSQGVSPYFPNPDTVSVSTNWQDAIFEAAPIQSYQAASAGGTDRITYYFSGNYYRQAGVLPKSDFNRLTLRVNNDYQLSRRFQLGHNLMFSYTDGQRPPGILSQLYQADPTIAPRNGTGAFNDATAHGGSAGNPAATLFYTRNEEQGGRLLGNLFAELNVRDRLTLRSSFGLDYARTEYRSFVPEYFVSSTQNNIDSDLRVETGQTSSWLWENTLTYSYASDDHRLNLLGGVTAQSFYNETLGCQRTDIVGEDENFWYCDAGNALGQINFNSASDWRMLSYLFRANYVLRDRYLFTASLRIDGSSRFGAANRFGRFPSVAVGWNLTDVPLVRDLGVFSALKLRASWGQIGNDKIGAYPGVAVVAGNLNTVLGSGETLTFGATPIALANPDVRWERTTQTNVGADMVLFGGRLEATVDYYRRLTDGILIRVPLPRYVGVAEEPFVNAAEVLNTGVEAELGWTATVGAAAYELGLTAATINNEVQALAQGKEFLDGGGLGNEVRFTTRTMPGHPVGCFWGFKVLGVFQTPAEIAAGPTRGGEQPGDLRYADLNGDGVIRDADDKTFLGCPIPDLIYGLRARVRWGGFDLSASLSGEVGSEVFNGKKAVRFGTDNFETSFLDRWTGPGTSSREPRITNAGHNYQPSDRFIENGSFLKLHSVRVGYQLPEGMTNRLRVGQATLYVSGTNLLQITPYSGYTPELTAESVIASGIDVFSGIFPPARMITVGLDLTF